MSIIHNYQPKFQTQQKNSCPMCSPRFSRMLHYIARERKGISGEAFRMEIALKVFNKYWDFKRGRPRE